MNLPAINPVWSSFIRIGSSGFYLFAIMLEKYLYTEFNRVSGFHFFKSLRIFPPLGIQVIVPSMIDAVKFPEFILDSKYLKIQKESSSMKYLKKLLLKPSGPGALLSFPDFIANSSSDIVYGTSSCSLLVSESFVIFSM